VRDLEASIAFYIGLGFRCDARLLNAGAAQADLDGLNDPVVDIAVLLTPEPGPHIELLHYRTPVGPPPVLGGADDIAATSIVMASPPYGAGADTELTDPDGHRLCFTTM
jgi:catechol 2,3-dioxygenase-like lactoylglutathione lyase family enzyme